MSWLFPNRRNKQQSFRERFKDSNFQSQVRKAREYRREARATSEPKTHLKLRTRRRRSVFVFVFSIFVIVGLVYFLFFSEFFLVRNATISGEEIVAPLAWSEIFSSLESKRYYKLVKRNNWWVINSQSLEQEILQQTKKFISVTSLKKRPPNKLQVSIQLVKPRFIWVTGEEAFSVSREGRILESVGSWRNTTTSEEVVIKDLGQTAISLGEILPYKKLLGFINASYDEWMASIKSKLVFVTLSSPVGQELVFSSSSGWQAYLDLSQDAVQQMKNLKMVLKQEIPPEKEPKLAYIDLRLPGKAYYCYVDEACASTEQKSQEQKPPSQN